MSDALEEHDDKVSIGGRSILNLRFAYDIDALAEEEQELRSPSWKSQQNLHKKLVQRRQNWWQIAPMTSRGRLR